MAEQIGSDEYEEEYEEYTDQEFEDEYEEEEGAEGSSRQQHRCPSAAG